MLDLTGALGFSQEAVRHHPQDDWRQKHHASQPLVLLLKTWKKNVSTLNQLNLKMHIFSSTLACEHNIIYKLINSNLMLHYKSLLMLETLQRKHFEAEIQLFTNKWNKNNTKCSFKTHSILFHLLRLGIEFSPYRPNALNATEHRFMLDPRTKCQYLLDSLKAQFPTSANVNACSQRWQRWTVYLQQSLQWGINNFRWLIS